ncbi:hypothetical protein D3C71_1473140 [compost metagenome]
MLEPGQGQRQRRAVALQPAGQFGDKGAIHRRVRARHVGDHQDQAGRVVLRGFAHGVSPGVGQPAIHVGVGQPDRHAPQVFDQGQAHHDGDGPEFAQLQGLDPLISGHERTDPVGIDPRIAMRDHLQRDVVHPGQPLGRAGGQLGQAAAIALGQVPLGQPDLFFDQVEIVQQPFVGRGDLAALLHRLDQQRAGLGQQRLVFRQPGQQVVLRAEGTQGMFLRQRQAVGFHLLRIEQFRAQRRLALGGTERGFAAREQVYPFGGSLQ